jgi:hypothetical protein
MADATPEYLVLPDSERVRLATDRLRSVETNHFQIELAELAGDPVNEQEKQRLKQAMQRLRAIVDEATASARTPTD